MYSILPPFIRNDALTSLFDLLEDHAYRVLEVYLKDHAWDDEAKRLIESRFVGVGTYRLLTNIAIEYLDGSPEELISFYERCKRPKDDPHYEDLIVTVLMGVVAGIIANLCYDVLKGKIRSLQDSKELADRLWNVFGRGINYLFRARWAREMLWHKKISKEDHDLVLKYMRVEYLARPTDANVDVDSNTRLRVELEFQTMARNHGLELADLHDSLILALMDLTSNLVELTDILKDFRALFEEYEEGRKDG